MSRRWPSCAANGCHLRLELMNLKHLVVRRDLFGSDIILLITILMHLCKAAVLLTTTDANWPIGVHAILLAFHNNSVAASLVLIIACVSTAVGEWSNGIISPLVRLLALFPLQAALLTISSIGVVVAIWTSAFPCSTVQCLDVLPIPRLGILMDQFLRLMWPLAYLTAVYARVRA